MIDSEKLFLTVFKIIDMLTGALGRLSGTSPESVTKYVTGHRIQNHPVYGSSLVCIDTPGLDDSHLSDMEILKMISEWLVCM
jgi:predicted GTPase